MIRSAALLCSLALPAGALELALPGERTVYTEEAVGRAAFATGPVADGAVPIAQHDGPLRQGVWESDTSQATQETHNDVIAEFEAQGFQTSFTCHAKQCGGFAFRFGIDLLPAPDLFVDLNDFHFTTLAKDGIVLSAFTTKSGTVTYTQVTAVGGPEIAVVEESDLVKSSRSVDPAFAQTGVFESGPSVVLEGLSFATGSTEITDSDLPVLRALASYMADHPDAAIALVGHSDAQGNTEANMRLSAQRAEAVRQALISDYGVSATRLTAKGEGPLSPRADNDTAEGMALNRRVEAVLEPLNQ